MCFKFYSSNDRMVEILPIVIVKDNSNIVHTDIHSNRLNKQKP